ncbi:hypothetical protein Dsin_000992 [Dipteronia sinensis]|uniref:Uncharacterized protein n=1 Tax=Dipteronia sinensis TaxID=43782 RepID=A0AAE0B3I6_9ROSI|nr:hypothetical protein Dsin_000992 [Dipteronia sinensis]
MQMRNQLNILLKTSVGEWVPDNLTAEERRRYTESYFGHFIRMHREMKFSGGIVHWLLMRELYHDGLEDEMRFMIGHHLVRFSKVEFYLITGLKFRVILDMVRYDMVENGIHERYFGGRDEVDFEQLRPVLRIGIFEQQYDVVKLFLVYMLN